jgi:TetR/AcrR family transcriptional regulator, tetracycline repressor protein
VATTIKRGTIDQRAVVDAATAVARRVGLSRMTMRMVADELGVSPMAAYRHVPNRESLAGLVADELTASVQVPDPASGSWDERLLALELSAFRARSTVSGTTDVASIELMLKGTHTRRVVQGMMAILADAGFDGDDAALAFEVVWAYFVGQLNAYEVIVHPTTNRRDADGESLWPILGQDTGETPVSPEEYFERGFHILLDGLRAMLARKVAAELSS